MASYGQPQVGFLQPRSRFFLASDSFDNTIIERDPDQPPASRDVEVVTRLRQLARRRWQQHRDKINRLTIGGAVGFALVGVILALIVTRPVETPAPTYFAQSGNRMILHDANLSAISQSSRIDLRDSLLTFTSPLTVVQSVSMPIIAPDLSKAPALPAWLNAECKLRMLVIGMGEVRGVDDQQTNDFVMTEILYTAMSTQCVGAMADQSVRGSLESVWNGWLSFVNNGVLRAPNVNDRVRSGLDFALAHWQLPAYPACEYVGSARDVFSAWLPHDASLAIDIALPSYPKAPQVYGVGCPRGK